MIDFVAIIQSMPELENFHGSNSSDRRGLAVEETHEHHRMTVARIDRGCIFRTIDRWVNLSKHALEPGAPNAILKQRLVLAGLEPEEFSAHSLRSDI